MRPRSISQANFDNVPFFSLVGLEYYLDIRCHFEDPGRTGSTGSNLSEGPKRVCGLNCMMCLFQLIPFWQPVNQLPETGKQIWKRGQPEKGQH